MRLYDRCTSTLRLRLITSPLADFLVGILVLAALPILFWWWFLKRQEMPWQKQIEEIVEAERREIERRSEAVAECLLELGLPQLEEKKKRLEVARRLCIAIFGR